MRIRVLSDLHLEFGAMELAAVDADVVVLAGDIHTKAHGVRWANTAFEVPVPYVLGNHESYGLHETHRITPEGDLYAGVNYPVRNSEVGNASTDAFREACCS